MSSMLLGTRAPCTAPISIDFPICKRVNNSCLLVALQALVESNELPQKPEPVKEEEEAKEEEE